MRRLMLAVLICGAALPVCAQQRTTIELPVQTVNGLLNFLLHPPPADRLDPGDVTPWIQAIQLCSQISGPESPAGVCDIVLLEFRKRAGEVAKALADGKVAGRTEAEQAASDKQRAAEAAQKATPKEPPPLQMDTPGQPPKPDAAPAK